MAGLGSVDADIELYMNNDLLGLEVIDLVHGVVEVVLLVLQVLVLLVDLVEQEERPNARGAQQEQELAATLGIKCL